MQCHFTRPRALSALLTLVLASSAALAQYTSTKLDSNLAGKAKQTDPLLKNGWGLAYAPSGAFWVSDEASGWSRVMRSEPRLAPRPVNSRIEGRAPRGLARKH